MVDVTLWYHLKFETLMVRVTRKSTLAAVPFIGAEINMGVDLATVQEVTFIDGGGIVAVVGHSKEPAGTEMILPDSDLEGIVEDFREIGWELLSKETR